MGHNTAMNILRKLDRIFDHAVDIAAVLGGIVLVLQTASVAGNTMLSFFFNRWITGVESLTEFGILYLTFLSTAWLLKHERHVKVDIVTGALSPKVQAVLVVITSVAGVGICLIFTIFGAYVTWDHWVRGMTDYAKLGGFPIAIPLAIIPLGSFMLSIQFVKRAYGSLQEISKLRTGSGDEN